MRFVSGCAGCTASQGAMQPMRVSEQKNQYACVYICMPPDPPKPTNPKEFVKNWIIFDLDSFDKMTSIKKNIG